MGPQLNKYRHLLPRRYPIWSLRSAMVYLTMVVGISALVVGFIPDLRIFVRMELALGVCAVALFWFMTAGLYRGVRLKKNDLPDVKSFTPSFSADDAHQHVVDLGSGFDVPIDADLGCLGILIASAVWLAVLLFGGLIIWALVQFGGWLILGFLFGLSWVVYRALRQVFARSRQCQGKLIPSLSWAMIYTTLYTSWLYALLLLGSWLASR